MSDREANMKDAFLNLTTSQTLVRALESAAQRKSTAGELFEQRVSFVFSAMGSSTGVTRERVKELVLQHDEVCTGA